MKIISYELFKVPPRWLFLKITTSEGIVGWGEPIIEGKADTVHAAVVELMETLIGKNPLHIEDHWNMMYRSGFYRGGPILMSAIAGIDQALWDIKGKYYNAPIYELMGGACRTKIRTYSWVGGDRPDDLIQSTQKVVDIGFDTVKMNASEELQIIDSYKKVDEIITRIGSLRDHFGDKIDIGIDFHGRVHKPMAKVLIKELEPFRPLFIEEPILPEQNDALKVLSQISAIPIAVGERMFSRWDFKQTLADGYVDIIQPDLSHAGGITEVKKIASMAEAYDVALAPHCPLGPIALAACLQVDATSYNAFIQEQSLGIHYNQGNDVLDYVKSDGSFHYDNGFIHIPTLPGLGIEVNEDYVREMSNVGHQWKNPVWRHKDGSIAEW
ncbi:galactonate dehydratase [Lysinibacillus piscis]|uniref:Galactonate dehydratase n=1 Tax=Lysinibacillus piscis TaxID=2518931 RepID=A0ABQ5NPR5_9BACI|nr:galactonate dehydratase [Lysinibacillus sp. KH24]GLC90356.1 galactonate dehydratase [Lysinibacillus sp. KH24]